MTPERAFDAGNYAAALMAAEEGTELRAAAMAMCGAVRPGLAALGAPETDRGRLAAAFAHWCLGEDAAASAALDGTPFQPLRALLAGGPVDVVLCHMPGTTGAEAFAGIEGFRLHPVVLEPEAFGVGWDGALADAPAGFAPVLALSLDAYGPYLPQGDGPPVVHWAGDHDYFLATRGADLAAAAAVLVNSAGEHAEMSAAYGSRIATFPCHDTYRDLAAAPDGPRATDALFTGRAFVPYMDDKARYLFRLATLDDPDLEIRIVDDYLPEESYAAALAGAKHVPVFWRYGGGIQTRGIEALSAGAAVLGTEAGPAAALLGGGENGWVDLSGLDDAALIAALKSPAPAPDPDVVRELFWPAERRWARLLKFACVQALLADPPAPRAAVSWLPGELRGYDRERGTRVYTRLAAHNAARAVGEPAAAIAAAAAALYGAVLLQTDERLTAAARELHLEGADRHPGNLVMRFNAGAALTLAGANDEARTHLEAVAEGAAEMAFDPRRHAVLSHRLRPLAEVLPFGPYYRAAAEGRDDTARDILAATALLSLGRAGAAVDRFQDHPAAWRALAEADGGLEAVTRAIALYPPALASLLAAGLDAAEAEGDEAAAVRLLRRWVLFVHRTRDAEGGAKYLHAGALAAARARRGLLGDWTGTLLDHMIAAVSED